VITQISLLLESLPALSTLESPALFISLRYVFRLFGSFGLASFHIPLILMKSKHFPVADLIAHGSTWARPLALIGKPLGVVVATLENGHDTNILPVLSNPYFRTFTNPLKAHSPCLLKVKLSNCCEKGKS
jgi:hypothetical protein